MMRSLLVIAVLLGLLPIAAARAHEARPAYLEITQTSASSYNVVWKQPMIGDYALRLTPQLSNGWLEREPNDQYAAAGFLIRTWRIEAGPSESLANTTITIEGLQNTITDALVRVRLLDGERREVLLRPESPHWRFDDARASSVPAFVVHGIEHILSGVDHLLFVFGLLCIVRDRWNLLKAVTAFTVAHSITLALAVVTKISLPSAFVETLIALSILFLGVEILRARRGGDSLMIRHPWLVAFFFGLFHGMGFASGLTALGFAEQDLVASLLCFNLGVEIGQLAFIGLVMLVGLGLSRLRVSWPRWQASVPAYGVGIAGAYWTWQTSTMWIGL